MRRIAFGTWYTALVVIVVSIVYGFFQAFTAGEGITGFAVVAMAFVTGIAAFAIVASYGAMIEWLDEDHPHGLKEG